MLLKEGEHHNFSTQDVILNLSKREGLELAEYLIKSANQIDNIVREHEIVGRTTTLGRHTVTVYMEGK